MPKASFSIVIPSSNVIGLLHMVGSMGGIIGSLATSAGGAGATDAIQQLLGALAVERERGADRGPLQIMLDAQITA